MPVRVARQSTHPPAVDLVALDEQLRVPGEADERREHVARLDQLLRDRLRDAVRRNQSAIRSGQSCEPQTRSHCA